MAKYNTLGALFTAIADSLRGKTGGSRKIVADDFPAMIDGLFTSGITPTGTKTITTNGSHDVTSYATAQVNVPIPDGYIKPSGSKTIATNGTHDVTGVTSAVVNVPTGITPSGTLTISANGTFDVKNYASVLANIEGINARIITATVAADATSGWATILSSNEFIASIKNNSKAFIMMRYMGIAPSTAMYSWWIVTGFPLFYAGTNVYHSIIARTTASATSTNFGGNGLQSAQYNGHLTVEANGLVKLYCSTTYPLRAGEYQIIAGTVEML